MGKVQWSGNKKMHKWTLRKKSRGTLIVKSKKIKALKPVGIVHRRIHIYICNAPRKVSPDILRVWTWELLHARWYLRLCVYNKLRYGIHCHISITLTELYIYAVFKLSQVAVWFNIRIQQCTSFQPFFKLR